MSWGMPVSWVEQTGGGLGTERLFAGFEVSLRGSWRRMTLEKSGYSPSEALTEGGEARHRPSPVLREEVPHRISHKGKALHLGVGQVEV